jgi:hypothetical protein
LTAFWRAPIERTPEGDFRVHLSREERRLVREVHAELQSLLDDHADDPSLRRLFPPAYDDDPEGEVEYQLLMGDELLAGRRKALSVLAKTLDNDRLRADELDTWLGALNDLRLMLGTRIDATEDMYERDLDPRDPGATDVAAYLYLTWLQDQAVVAVLADRA